MSSPVQAEGGERARQTVPTEIKGNTLRVYLFLLKQGPSELREVQRGLGFSTPSLASYHLDKLVSIGYASQTERGAYQANRDSLGQVVEGFSKVGTIVVPQLLFVAVLFTPLIAYFGYMALHAAQYVPVLVATAAALAGLAWFETFRVWRKLSA